MVESTHDQPQPWNYGFGAYSVDLGAGAAGSTTPMEQSVLNFNYFRRMPWANDTMLAQDQPNATDVSWVYGLFGDNTKYTFNFNYYCPQTGYLYFPYKLVKTSDKVGLQYKLNQADPVAIQFSEVAATASTPAPAETDGTQESAETTTANEEVNPMPSINTINVAKVTLTNLKYGSNTIEFSVPSTNEEANTKVAPMIGNMYISSSPDAKNKVYNDIFGNEVASNNNDLTINFVTGYTLAADYSTFMVPYTTKLANISDSQSIRRFLIGFVGGTIVRSSKTNGDWFNTGNNPQKVPGNSGTKRTFTFM
ncbi:hypothetical protein ABOD99_01825 [Mycoplasmoides gallisepticum]